MCDLTFKTVLQTDLEQCIPVIRGAFDTVAEDFGLTRQNCPTNPAFIKDIHLQQDYEKGNRMIALMSDKQIVGFMQLEQGEAGIYYLKNVAVLPAHRHLGYGKKLLDYAKDSVLALGGDTIRIGIIEENIVLKDWYAKHGFNHTGTKKFDHLPFTVGFMEMKLDV